MFKSIKKSIGLYFFIALVSGGAFGKNICGMSADLHQQSVEKLQYVKSTLQLELVTSDKRLVLLDHLYEQAFNLPNITGKSSHDFSSRSKSEFLEIVRLSRESSHKLESLLKEVQALAFMNRRCD